MKKNQGITLISLIVYIIVMLIAISLITMITTSMTKNLGTVEKASKSATKINKFDMYFLSDIKNVGVSIYAVKNDDTNKYIIVEDESGNDIQYIFKENVIYRIYSKDNSQIQICNDISEFSAEKLTDKTIKLKIQSGDYVSEKTYKLGKW